MCFFTEEDRCTPKLFRRALTRAYGKGLSVTYRMTQKQLDEYWVLIGEQFYGRYSDGEPPVRRVVRRVGLQPYQSVDDIVYVFNEDTQMNRHGREIPMNDRKYVWLGKILLDDTRMFTPGVARPADAITVAKPLGEEGLYNLFKEMKSALNTNYMSGLFACSGAIMQFHLPEGCRILPTRCPVRRRQHGKDNVTEMRNVHCWPASWPCLLIPVRRLLLKTGQCYNTWIRPRRPNRPTGSRRITHWFLY